MHSNSDECEKLKKKLSEMHVLDGLDHLNDETSVMEDDICSGLLREHAQELKGMLPNSHNEAWNHPDEKFGSDGESQLERSLKAQLK